MPFRTKLLLAFGVIGLMACAIGFLAIRINLAVAHDVGQISHSSIDESRAADGMSEALHEIEISLLRASSGKIATPEQRHAVTTAVANFESALATFGEATQTAISMAREEKSPLEIAEAEDDARLHKEIEEKFPPLKSIALSAANNTAAGIGTDSPEKLYEEIHAAVKEYQETTSSDLQHEIDVIANAISRANLIIISSTIGIVLMGCLLAWRIARSVSRPLTLLTKAAEQISQGRLDTRVVFESQDEIGLLAKTFNKMTEDLGTTTVSRDYLDSILKSMANSLIVIDLNRTILSTNAATLRMLKYTEAELIGQPMEAVLPDSQRLSTKNGKSEAHVDVETSYRMKSGEFLPVTFSASLLRSPAGEAIGMVCVAQDISARKQAEYELEQAGKKLLETSRQAGMAEVAASVLHNVGNALNSVNVSSCVIADAVRMSKASNLANAVALMQAHADDLPGFFASDPKGKLLPNYLADLSSHLISEEEMILREVQSLINNITHIKEIVGMQQNYAKTTGVAEDCNAVELVETAVQINGNSLERHHIAVVREYANVPPILTEKHRVLQILVNLIRNAQYACDASDKTDKRITFRITNEDGCVQISVIDNGMGIPPENLTLIFGHGFTTKKGGHGFGLHSSALTAKELGGKLNAFSNGPDTGATFTLEMPLRNERDR